MHTLPWALILLALAIPPLTPAQRAQLDTADDGQTYIDQPALYPLLDNATQWQPGDEAGAMIPDLDAILADPASFRGQLFLLEGDFAGRPRDEGGTLRSLARPGPWSGRLQEWVLVTDRAKDQVVVVYLVNPPVPIEAPLAAGTPVRTVGRFYRVWHDTDSHGNAVPYLTFVGHGATVVGRAAVRDRIGGLGSLGTMLMVVMLLGAGFIFLRMKRRSLNARPLATRVRRMERARAEKEGGTAEADHEAEAPVVDEGPPLPKDPAEALVELERRRALEAQRDRRTMDGESPRP